MTIDESKIKIDSIIAHLKKIKNKDTTTEWHIEQAILKLEMAKNYLYYATIK